MKTLQILVLSLLLPSTLLATSLDKDRNRTETWRQEQTYLVSLLNERKEIGEIPLRHLKDRLRKFTALLDRKMEAAEPATKILSTPALKMVQDVLSGPETSLLPDSAQYRIIATLFSEIGNNPVLAMTFEETLLPQDLQNMAVIMPDRGRGASYNENEAVRFLVTAVRDCFVQVIYLARETAGKEHERLIPLRIFPESGMQSASMKAGQTMYLGEKGGFTVQPPFGIDIVVVIASEDEQVAMLSGDDTVISAPLHFDRFLAELYGEHTAQKLSFSSGFFVSRPSDNYSGGSRGLLTEDEAGQLRLDEEEWARAPLQFRSVSAGPLIRVHEPGLTDEENPTIETGTPMNLKITFEANKAPVDMTSLEVTARKGFLAKTITDRVLEYIDGTLLDARNLDFPKGKFRIQVEIADVDGVATSQEYRLMVR